MRPQKRAIFRLVVSTLALAAVLAASAPLVTRANPSWYDSAWQYRKKITINAANVTADLTNFPVLINLTSDADLAADAQDDGDDILFTAADEVTKLSHEIEKFDDATGRLAAWVRVPSLSSSVNTEIYIYYGNGVASSQQDAAGVWDANYKMVQHLEEASGGANAITDSTSNANHGTDGNTPTFGATGQIDGAISFTKASNEHIQLPASNQILNADNFTLEAWIKTSTNHPAYGDEGRIVNTHRGAVSGSAVSIYVQQNQIALFYYDTTSHYLQYTANYYDGNTHHIAATHSSGDNTYRLYFDGVQVASEANGFVGFGTYPAFIATHNTTERSFDGIIDEARISSSVRSADWIKTSFNNQSSPGTFYTFGSEEVSVPLVTVGGEVYPINIAEVLLPWLVMASFLALAAWQVKKRL